MSDDMRWPEWRGGVGRLSGDDDVLADIRDAAASLRPCPNGRIQDGHIFVTEAEYAVLRATMGEPKYQPEPTSAAAASWTVTVVHERQMIGLRDGRAMTCFDGRIYLLPSWPTFTPTQMGIGS